MRVLHVSYSRLREGDLACMSRLERQSSLRREHRRHKPLVAAKPYTFCVYSRQGVFKAHAYSLHMKAPDKYHVPRRTSRIIGDEIPASFLVTTI